MPGDLFMERRIRSLIRWNALALVLRANKNDDDLGGGVARVGRGERRRRRPARAVRAAARLRCRRPRARAGEPRCPNHGTTLEAQTVSQMVDHVLALPEGERLMLLAPVIEARKGEHLQVFDSLRAQGFVRARVDGMDAEAFEAAAQAAKNGCPVSQLFNGNAEITLDAVSLTGDSLDVTIDETLHEGIAEGEVFAEQHDRAL